MKRIEIRRNISNYVMYNTFKWLCIQEVLWEQDEKGVRNLSDYVSDYLLTKKMNELYKDYISFLKHTRICLFSVEQVYRDFISYRKQLIKGRKLNKLLTKINNNN